MASLLFPLQFERQYSGPLDQDQVFATTADRLAYLTSALRYAGQIVSDVETGKVYQLNAAKDAWIEIGGSSGTSSAELTAISTLVSSNSANWGLVTISDPLKFKFTADGSTKNFSVSGTNDSTNASYIDVYIENVKQEPEFSYTLSADTVKFIEFPESGSEIVVITPNTKFVNLENNTYNIPTFVNSGTATISQELTDKINITSTLVQTNSALWAAGSIVSKTYAELKVMRESAQLAPGQTYKITDFQLKWWNLSVNDNTVKTSDFIEPINVTATSTNKFSNLATSDLYPQDILYYDFEATTSKSWGTNAFNSNPIPNFKGDIYRRIDTVADIDIYYDWRHIKVNCCRPDLTSIQTWSSSLTANLYDVVKLNGKLFVSIVNTNNELTSNVYAWQPLSDYNEEYTYYPTDETFCLTLVRPVTGVLNMYNFYSYLNTNPTAYIFNLPALTSTRVQKYTFNNDPESVGSRSFHSISIKLGTGSHSNLFCGYGSYIDLGYEATYNIFRYDNTNIFSVSNFSRNIIGYNVQNNSFGSEILCNIFSNQFTDNNFFDTIKFNKFSNGQLGNTFNSQVAGNFFSSGFNTNSFRITVIGNLTRPGFVSNNLSPMFCGNSFGKDSGNNTTLGKFANNRSDKQVAANIFGQEFVNNAMGEFQKNDIGSLCINNVFPFNCTVNKIGSGFEGNTATPASIATGGMYYNVISQDFQYNSIGTTFKMNEIGTRMTGCTLGTVFRKNKITGGDYIYGSQMLNGVDFTSSTHVANDYDCTIQKRSDNQLILSYLNSSNAFVFVSPTS